jgi:hypothetical protein
MMALPMMKPEPAVDESTVGLTVLRGLTICPTNAVQPLAVRLST